jgi:phage baseplate assembly protein W
MSRRTGKRLSPEEHIRQSLEDILSTPKGSRVMLRDYGSRLFELLGKGIDKMSIFTAVHEAVARWEPRVRLNAVKVLDGPEEEKKLSDGKVSILLDGVIKVTDTPFSWDVRLER